MRSGSYSSGLGSARGDVWSLNKSGLGSARGSGAGSPFGSSGFSGAGGGVGASSGGFGGGGGNRTSRGRAGGSSVLMPSAVDEAIKVPMVRDVLRIVAALHGLSVDRHEADDTSGAAPPAAATSTTVAAAASATSSSDALTASSVGGPPPPPAAPTPPPFAPPFAPPSPEKLPGVFPSGMGKLGERSRKTERSGAFGTSFHEILADTAESRHLQLIARLRDIFEQHTPSSELFDSTWGDARAGDAKETSGSGPKWRSQTWARFLQTTGIAGGHRASAVAAGLAGPDAELIFTSVCGKQGSMDLLDFAEGLARVAARVYPWQGAATGHGRAGGEVSILQTR